MIDYGQFCPIAKASEIIGERWTLLILRELLMGATRYSDLQRTLGHISPTVLVKRLKSLEEHGLLVRTKIPGQRRHEYRLTAAGKDLKAVVVGLGEWGMRWARGQMSDDELDVQLLMVYICRSLRCKHLPDGQTVIKFHFPDLDEFGTWWVVATDGEVDLCIDAPSDEPDVRFSSDLRTMTEIFMGDLSLKDGRKSGKLKIKGQTGLLRNVGSWLGLSIFAGIKPEVRETA